MRYPTLISLFLVVLFAGCKKDNFSTTPSLKFESVNTKELQRQQSIRFTLSFTDAEGDLSDTLVISKIASNCVNSNFINAKYALPPFPSGKNQKGEIVVTYSYNDVSPKCPQKNDTAVFKFVLKDKAQNVSDTISSPQIIIVN